MMIHYGFRLWVTFWFQQFFFYNYIYFSEQNNKTQNYSQSITSVFYMLFKSLLYLLWTILVFLSALEWMIKCHHIWKCQVTYKYIKHFTDLFILHCKCFRKNTEMILSLLLYDISLPYQRWPQPQMMPERCDSQWLLSQSERNHISIRADWDDWTGHHVINPKTGSFFVFFL